MDTKSMDTGVHDHAVDMATVMVTEFLKTRGVDMVMGMDFQKTRGVDVDMVMDTIFLKTMIHVLNSKIIDLKIMIF